MFPNLLKMVQVKRLKLLRIRLWGCIIGLLVPLVKKTRIKEPKPFKPIELEQAFGGAYRSYRVNRRPKIDFDSFFNKIRKELIGLIKRELKTRPSARIQTTAWKFSHEKFLHPVSVCQKKAVRAMTFNDPLAHTSPIFSELQLLKLEDIHCLYISSFVYECHNKLAPIHFRDYFTQMSEFHSYNTRGAARGDIFLVRKNTLQSLLISETLHQSETSRINSKNSFYNLTVTKRKIQILS